MAAEQEAAPRTTKRTSFLEDLFTDNGGVVHEDELRRFKAQMATRKAA